MCLITVLVFEARTREVFSFGMCNEYGLKNEAVWVKISTTHSGNTNHISFGRNGMLAYLSVPFLVNLLPHSPCFIHLTMLLNLCCTEKIFGMFRGREHGVY